MPHVFYREPRVAPFFRILRMKKLTKRMVPVIYGCGVNGGSRGLMGVGEGDSQSNPRSAKDTVREPATMK